MQNAKPRPTSCRNGTNARPGSMVDSVFEQINSEKVQRGRDGPGGLLPYLSAMSPSPTYANLSKVALDIANEHRNKTKQPQSRQSTDQESEKTETSEEFDEFENELVGKHVEREDAEVETKSKKTEKESKSDAASKIRWGNAEPPAPEDDLLPKSLPKNGKTSPFMRAESASPHASYLHFPQDVSSKDCKSVGLPVGVTSLAGTVAASQPAVGSDAFATLSLNKLHSLWNEHASNMDANGRNFVQRLEDTHGQALMDISAVKVFDLKPLLAIVQGFCDNLRFMFVEKIRKARQLEDGFGYTVYKLASDSFAKAMQQEITIRDDMYRKKVKDLGTKHMDVIEKARSSAVHERMRALEAQKAVLERRLEAEMAEVKAKFERERNEALNQVTRMEQKLELISTECDSLKANHKAIKDELQSNQRWQVKFEKERSKCQTLRNEMEGLSRHQETKLTQLMQQCETDVKQRDAIIDRSKETIIRLEMQLRGEKQLRAREALAARALEPPPPPSHAAEAPDQTNDNPATLKENHGAPPLAPKNRRNSFMMDTQRSMARRVTLTRKTSRNSSFGGSSVNSVRMSLEDQEICSPIALAAARSPSVLSTGSVVTGSGGQETPESQTIEESAIVAAPPQSNLPVLAEDPERLNECVMVSPKAVATRTPSFERGRTSRRSSFTEHSEGGEPLVEKMQT
ncbi:hypothetical protein BSKO_04897 [Bryopsis sp. KO-2023]|nr:hypothetical protein BSKO_04897 [Bryopsis sp. KO-2023]